MLTTPDSQGEEAKKAAQRDQLENIMLRAFNKLSEDNQIEIISYINNAIKNQEESKP